MSYFAVVGVVKLQKTIIYANIISMLKNFSRKKSIIIFAVCYAALFIALMAVGSAFDLQISQRLTKGVLAAGQYYTDSVFAKTVEVVGASPIWIAMAFAFCFLFKWFFDGNFKKPLKILCCVAAFGAGIFVCFKLFAEILKYLLRDSALSAGVFGVCLACGVATWIGIFTIANNFKADRTKLLRFAAAILCVSALYLIVALIKTPVGRVRYRALNVLGSTEKYTAWFVVNGKRFLEGLPSDACRSFPSGHTFSAGLIAMSLCLPYVSQKYDKKVWRIVFWTVSVAYTGLVAIGRVAAGAHYLTDVVAGGTLSLTGALVAREIALVAPQNKAEQKVE